MRTAYKEENLRNLILVKTASTWSKCSFISRVEYDLIKRAYPCAFYHPNISIRVLIFIASLLGLSGLTGLFTLLFSQLSQDALAVMAIIYGLVSFAVLERVVINRYHHYKSGLTEAILYHSMAFLLIGLAVLLDFEEQGVLWTCLIVFLFAAFRYLDLLSTFVALSLGTYLLFYYLLEFGDFLQGLIPIFFLGGSATLYFFVKKLQNGHQFDTWEKVILLVEAFSLLVLYASGNYFVVRELSIELMSFELTEGQDIPFAWLFYSLTMIIPLLYLYFGVVRRDSLLLRVSLLVIAFAVFTFKYYYSLGHPEISLTIAGLLLLVLSIVLLRYLKNSRNGFTRESLLSENWASANAEAFVVSQTLGDNKLPDTSTNIGGGGSFGGGGASGSF